MKTGIERIAAERERQVKREGWSAEHDDGYVSGELAEAAVAYATAEREQMRGVELDYLEGMTASGYVRYPWEDGWWKPSADPVRNLEKAGALIAAEIDRLLRERERRADVSRSDRRSETGDGV